MKLKLFLLAALAVYIFPNVIFAASFSLTIDRPKSPSRIDNFNLTGTSLDRPNATRNITVKCYKKGPSDSNFVQFDTDQILIPGGNVYSCSVNNSTLNSDGVYSFKTVASVSEPSFEQLTSDIVNYDYNTSGPSTPVNYSKERLNSCDYKIKFKTADDGKTVKVQIFRSDTLSIHVDAGAVLTSVNISPNTEGEITNSVPICGKDYYHVIRAVDSSDNASGTIGDSFTTTTTTSTTTGSVAGSQTGGTGAIVLTDASAQVAEPGQTTSDTPEPIIDNSQAPTPSILGTYTEDRKKITKWLLGAAAIIVGYLLMKARRRSKSK